MAKETGQDVAVQKVKAPEVTRLPIFEELEKRMQQIQQRAFELFHQRGGGIGQDLDDWLNAEREVNGDTTTDLKETDDAYELEVALPGMETQDVEVTATPQNVIVRARHREEETREGAKAGNKKAEEKKEGLEADWREVTETTVFRQVPMVGIDPDKVTAKLQAGKLRITAKKAPAKEQRRVVAVA